MTTESRANSLRAYAENLLETEFELDQEQLAELVDDLIEFAEQWESELAATKQSTKYPDEVSDD